MKKILGCLCIFALVAACDQTKTPQEVVIAFETMFPEAESASWKMENKNDWEVDFIMNNNEISACFDSKGNWLETEVEIEWEELPEEVIKSIELNYGEFEIKTIESVKSPDFAGYEVEFTKEDSGKRTVYEVYFDNEGIVTKIEHENDDDE